MATPITIRRGSRGATVKTWQSILGVTVDGIFGRGTESATKAWQKARGLTPDGIVGKNTWNAAKSAVQSPEVVMSPESIRATPSGPARAPQAPIASTPTGSTDWKARYIRKAPAKPSTRTASARSAPPKKTTPSETGPPNTPTPEKTSMLSLATVRLKFAAMPRWKQLLAGVGTFAVGFIGYTALKKR